MRFIHRSALLGVMAVFAVGLVGVASASAAECPGTGEGVVLCSGGHVQEGTFAFTGTSVVHIRFAGWGSPECASATSAGDFVATKTHVEVTGLMIDATNCKLAGYPTCTVKPIAFGGEKGFIGSLSTPGEITLSPSGGERALFTEVKISGCEQENVFKVKGHQVCTLPKSTLEATSHVVQCLESGSDLLWGTHEAWFTNSETIKLTSGKAFSLQKS